MTSPTIFRAQPYAWLVKGGDEVADFDDHRRASFDLGDVSLSAIDDASEDPALRGATPPWACATTVSRFPHPPAIAPGSPTRTNKVS